jgi:hypothetical protein
MSLLLIQNPGVSPVEGFCLLGISTTRDCGVEGTIGKFGSGTKHAVNVLLRAGLPVTVYCGKTKLDFLTKDAQVNDGLTTKTVKQVYVQFGGTSTKKVDLGWVLDFGAVDWTRLGMALREFISNAIDRTLREECGQFEAAIKEGRLSVRKVPDTDVRAKDGYTRVFVGINDEVEKYLAELAKRFLHFSDTPSDVKRRFLPKANRSVNGSAMIYRAGVFVRELQEYPTPSVYDYNFQTDELQIDECRNSSEYAIRAGCAQLLRKATTDELVPILRSLTEMEKTFEAGLDDHYLCSSWETPKQEQKDTFKRAWEAVAGTSVMCEPMAHQVELVQRKGYMPKTVQSSTWVRAAERFGIPTATTVLSAAESKGHEPCSASLCAEQSVAMVWEWIASLGMTQGKTKPQVACYRDITNGETDCMGYYEDGTVYFREDIASGNNKYLLKTALEECVHHVTRAGDNTRDIQNYLVDMVVNMKTRDLEMVDGH